MRLPHLRLTVLFLTLTCTALACAAPCAAQSADTPASPRLQDAVIRAKGGTLTITRLPIHTASGIIYRDVTIELQVDESGNVTLNTDTSGHALVGGMPGGAPAGKVTLSAPPAATGKVELAQRPSAPLVLQHFTPGTYEAPGSPLVKLSAAGTESLHGLPKWSLTTIGDANGPVERATWFSGPPTLTPIAHRLEAAGIDNADLAYGTAASGSTEQFGGGALIGVSQQGRTLIVISFRMGCCSASPKPAATLIFSRVGQ